MDDVRGQHDRVGDPARALQVRLDAERRAEPRAGVVRRADAHDHRVRVVDGRPVPRLAHGEVVGPGRVGEVERHRPVLLAPDVLRLVLRHRLGRAGRGENQVSGREVLDDVDVVLRALAGKNVLRGVVDLEHDVARRADGDVDPQLEHVHRARLDALARLAHRPALDVDHEGARLLRGGYAHLEVLGDRLPGVQRDDQREADLPAERQQPLLLALDGARVVEGERVEHVTDVRDGDREDGRLALLHVGLQVRRVQLDAVAHVHHRERQPVRADGRVLVRHRRDGDVGVLVVVRLVDRRRADAQVDARRLAAREVDRRVGEDGGVVAGEEQRRRPVGAVALLRDAVRVGDHPGHDAHDGQVQREGVRHQVDGSGRGVVDGHVEHRLLAGLDDVQPVGVPVLEEHVHLSGEDVRVADGVHVVVRLVVALVGVRPGEVRPAAEVVDEGGGLAQLRGPARVRAQLVGLPGRHRHDLPLVDDVGRQRVERDAVRPVVVGVVEAGVDHLLDGAGVAVLQPGDVHVVLVVGDDRGHDRAGRIGPVRRDVVLALDV